MPYKMLYWPYSEKVPQHIGLYRKSDPTGGTMKGTAKGPVNVKSLTTGELVTTLQVGDYVYGDWSSAKTDLINFTHVYRANGVKVELGKACKASVVNLTITAEAEPTGGGTTPPHPPTGVEIDYIDVVMKDGTRQKFVPQV